MSNVPYYVPGARAGMRYGHGQILDGLVKDGLWDVYNDMHMVSACTRYTAAAAAAAIYELALQLQSACTRSARSSHPRDSAAATTLHPQ